MCRAQIFGRMFANCNLQLKVYRNKKMATKKKAKKAAPKKKAAAKKKR